MHGLRITIALVVFALALTAARGGTDPLVFVAPASSIALPSIEGEPTFDTLLHWPDVLERTKRKLKRSSATPPSIEHWSSAPPTGPAFSARLATGAERAADGPPPRTTTVAQPRHFRAPAQPRAPPR